MKDQERLDSVKKQQKTKRKINRKKRKKQNSEDKGNGKR